MSDSDEASVREWTLRGRAAHAEAWRDLERRYGVLDVPAVARLLHLGTDSPDGSVPRQVRAGLLLGVERVNGLVLPAFQFDPARSQPLPGLRAVLAVFSAAGWDPDSIALWFTSPDPETDDEDPAARLASHPHQVLRAAQSITSPW